MSHEIILEPADVFATRGKSWLSKAIRIFTRHIGESRTKVNHVGVVVEGGTLRDAVSVEALIRVTERSLAAGYGGRGSSEVAVFRPINLTEEEKATIVAAARKYVGHKYGFLKLLAHLGDWFLQGAYVFRRLAFMKRYPICSWLVAHSFDEVGKHFAVDAGAATPDDIWDFCVGNPNKYRTVLELGPLYPCLHEP